MLRHFLKLFCLIAVLVGCGKTSPTDAIVRVGDDYLTSSEIARRAEIMVALTAHHSGKTNTATMIRKVYGKRFPAHWVESRALAHYAAAKGIDVPEKTLAAHRQAAFRNFKSKGDKNYEQLIAATVKESDRGLWEGQVYDEGLRTVLQKHFVELYPTNFGMSYAENEIAKMQAYNARMALTNALQYAKATNAWQRICRGEDFVKVGKEMTELDDEREDDCDWLEVDAKFLSDEPALASWLGKMKVGDITSPIEADNGLMIARLDRIEDEGVKALSRIFFHLPQFLTPAPKEEIVRRAEHDYAVDLFKRRAAELVSAADVEYFENKTKNNTKGK